MFSRGRGELAYFKPFTGRLQVTMFQGESLSFRFTIGPVVLPISQVFFSVFLPFQLKVSALPELFELFIRT